MCSPSSHLFSPRHYARPEVGYSGGVSETFDLFLHLSTHFSKSEVKERRSLFLKT